MGTFSASLKAIGDVRGLDATVELQDGVISIAAGDTPIGEWPLEDIRMEPIPTGYRIAAEGDQILLEVRDLERFNEELTAKRSRFKRRKKGVKEAAESKTEVAEPKTQVAVPEPAPTPEPPPTPRAEPTRSPESPIRLEPNPESAPEKKRRRSRRKDRTEDAKPAAASEEVADSFGAKVVAWIDSTVDRASDVLGPYLPEWVFTRLMFGIVVIGLILALILPGFMSAFMLIAGALTIVFGAVAYSDPLLTSKWLPGRTTPTHVLLFGVVILMLGVLLGVIAG